MDQNKLRNQPDDVRNRGTLIRNVVYHEVFRDEL